MQIRTNSLTKAFFALGIFFCFSCGANQASKEAFAADRGQAYLDAGNGLSRNDTSAAFASRKLAENTPPANDNGVLLTERKMIKNGRLRFETDNLEKTAAFVETVVKKFSGFIEHSTGSTQAKRNSIDLTVRLPSQNFDDFISELSTGVKKFDYKELYTDDVTADFIDYTARLNVKKETELRYLKLLDKARSVSEIIEIENALKTIREEIESLEGQLRFLNSQVDFSTINLSFYTENTEATAFGAEIADAFKTGGRLLYLLFIELVTVWPLLLIAALAVFLVLTLKRKKKVPRQ